MKVSLRVDSCHAGTGGDGRVDAMPFRGAIDGLTSVACLGYVTTTTIVATAGTTSATVTTTTSAAKSESGGVAEEQEQEQEEEEEFTFTSRTGYGAWGGGALTRRVQKRMMQKPRAKAAENAATAGKSKSSTPLGVVRLSSVLATGGQAGLIKTWRLTASFTPVPTRQDDDDDDDHSDDSEEEDKDDRASNGSSVSGGRPSVGKGFNKDSSTSSLNKGGKKKKGMGNGNITRRNPRWRLVLIDNDMGKKKKTKGGEGSSSSSSAGGGGSGGGICFEPLFRIDLAGTAVYRQLLPQCRFVATVLGHV